MTPPAFPSEPYVRAYQAALTLEGYDLDSTLRARLLMESPVPSMCANLADFSVPFRDVDAALTARYITEPTARLITIWQSYDGFSLTPTTEALLTAVADCERAATRPCRLPELCAHFPAEVHSTMAARPEQNCATLFSKVASADETLGLMLLRTYFVPGHVSEKRFLLREEGRPFDDRRLTAPEASIAANVEELRAFRDAQAFVAAQRGRAASDPP
jgi:hypothetical protein